MFRYLVDASDVASLDIFRSHNQVEDTPWITQIRQFVEPLGQEETHEKAEQQTISV